MPIQQMFLRSFWLLVLLAGLVLSLSTTAAAQSTTDGAIGGTVSDQHGGVVPQATVTVRNIETNKEETGTTDDTGRFRVVGLRPGTYTVTVIASGFAPYKAQNIIVEIGRVTPVDIPLAIGTATETVEVRGEAPVVDTARQDFANNINQVSINELPINGRRWSNFALLTPGTVPDGGFGLISFRGISGLLNNSTVDGGDNNQAFFSEERGRTRLSYVVSQASVSEFQVNTSNYSAEYGRAAGGVVNTITKSGTNRFHGTAFYYIRDNALGATNPFTTQTILVGGVSKVVPLKPLDRRQQFGGNIGGPIVKDKVFFFFNYDQQKRLFPGVAGPQSPLFLNPITVATAVADCTSPTLTAGQTLFCRKITQAQVDGGLAFLRGLTGTVPRTGDQWIIFPKVDWNINSKNVFTASYNRLRWNSPAGVQTAPIVFRGIASWGDDFVNVDFLNLRLTSTISPRVVNEARFQYGRDNEFQNSQPPGPGEPTTGKGGRPPQAEINTGGGGISIGKPDFLERRANPDEKRWQFADSVTLTRGKHIFKFGGDFNRVHDFQDTLFQESGAYSYSTLADFLSDFANAKSCGTATPTGPVAPFVGCYSSFGQGVGPTAFQFVTTDLSFFAQDDWRAAPRLTLNLGLRYEFEKLPSPQFPNAAAPQTGSFPSNRANFGPRIGFAWDITGDGKTSLRGGYGIYYGRIINSTISNAITNTGTTNAQSTISFKPTSPGAPLYPNVVPTVTGVAPTTPDIVVFAPNMKTPLIHEFDLVVEREIAHNTVISASYLGSLGRRLPTFVDTNLTPPTATITYTVKGGQLDGQPFTMPLFTGTRPNPTFGRILQIQSVIQTRYNAFVAGINRRFTNGLQFSAGYTVAFANDNGQISQTFTSTSAILNPFDLSVEQGRSNFDVRHRFGVSAIWSPEFFKGGDHPVARALVNGFTIAPIVGVSSGVPITGTVSGNAPGPSTGPNHPTSFGILGAGAGNRPPFISRNAFQQPRTVNVDLRLSRRFRFTETTNLEILAEAFNLFNHPNITGVQTKLYTIGGQNTMSSPAVLTFNPAFLAATTAGNTLIRERQIQLAVRFAF